MERRVLFEILWGNIPVFFGKLPVLIPSTGIFPPTLVTQNKFLIYYKNYCIQSSNYLYVKVYCCLSFVNWVYFYIYMRHAVNFLLKYAHLIDTDILFDLLETPFKWI